MTQIIQLDINMTVVMAWADAKGMPSGMLSMPSRELYYDSAIVALMKAAKEGDAAKIKAAMPAAALRYQIHINRLDEWVAAIGGGEVLSKKVVKVAEIVMLAISIYQVVRTPVVSSGGSATPGGLAGLLPGGVAVGFGSNPASLASAAEAIRKLVAIGALDGAIIAGLGSMGGGPSVALPELQRPTSFSMQATPPSGGSGAGAGAASSGASSAPSPASRAQRIKELVKEAQKEFPSKAGTIEQHHIKPQYFRGTQDGRTVPVDAAYHQKITNEFRREWPYGSTPPSEEKALEIMARVYDKFPLPK